MSETAQGKGAELAPSQTESTDNAEHSVEQERALAVEQKTPFVNNEVAAEQELPAQEIDKALLKQEMHLETVIADTCGVDARGADLETLIVAVSVMEKFPCENLSPLEVGQLSPAAVEDVRAQTVEAVLHT